MTPTPHRKPAAIPATLAALAFVLAWTPPARAADVPATASAPAAAETLPVPQAEVEKLLAAYALIKRNYVGQADDRKLFDGALSGMLASLDAHSQYMNGDDMRDLERENTGEYVGIGIAVDVDGGRMRVATVQADSPAARAGLQPGDILTSIDGSFLAGLADSEVARRMRGAPGTVAALGVTHEGKPRTVRITRAALHDATVATRMAAPGLAWIRIAEFGGATGADLAAALRKLDGNTPPRGLILDLRNDPGGLIPAAVAVAGAFLAPDTVLFSARGNAPGANATVTVNPRYYRQPDQTDVLADLPAWTRTVPLTVLVNGASASAAELVAGALQDGRRATVVGSRTFGKGSIQSVIPLGAESGIKFTVARYFTPNGHEIQARGVTPDIVVTPAAAADDGLLLREADLANHLPPLEDRPAVALPAAAAGRDPVESTRTFGTRDDKALQAALALLASGRQDERQQGPTLAGVLHRWRQALAPGGTAAAAAP
jgi:carboxyl-terminal processing protease